MKKYFLLCLFLTTVFTSLQGQNKKVVDSLLQITESDVSVKVKADAYLRIAFEHVGSDSVGYKYYFDKGWKIADSIGYEEGKMDAMYIKGRNALLSGDYVNSENYLVELLEGSNKIDYKKGIANAYYGRAWLNYYQGSYDQCIDFHLKSLELRKGLGDNIDISDCLRGIGIAYKLKGDFDEALDYLNQSLRIEKEINNRGGIATTLNHIGIINSLRGDYSYAMDIYFEALDIERELDDKSGLAYTYQNIGVIYDTQKDYPKALEYYHESLSLRKEIGERRGVAQIINYIGVVYQKSANYEKALEQYQEALNIKQELGDKRGVADGNLNIGKLYADQGMQNKAIEYKKKALAISEEINSDWGKVGALISLGESYQQLGKFSLSKQYLMNGIALAKEAQLFASVRDGAWILASVEKDMSNFRDAYDAMVVYQQMSDSISNVEITKRITLMEARFNFQQERDSIQFANEKEKLILDQQIQSQKTTQLITLVAIAVLVLIIAILFGFYRFKIAANKRLSQLNTKIQERNDSLRALNEEKNHLIGIVAHDLQNPLSGIIGALDLMDQKEMSEENRSMKDLIHISSTRMHKMIKEILNIETIEKGLDGIKSQPYHFSKAVSEVCKEYERLAKEKNISIEQSIDRNIQILADERYIVQIVENLVSNAIKFSPHDKKVQVTLSEVDGKARLQVKDEGPGLSEGDKKMLFHRYQRLSAKPTGGESSTGLGLSIVKMFVERMDGTIWCESELGQGASFFVEFAVEES